MIAAKAIIGTGRITASINGDSDRPDIMPYTEAISIAAVRIARVAPAGCV